MNTLRASLEPLETRRLLAIIGPDFTYGDRGLAPDTPNVTFIGLQNHTQPVLLRYANGAYLLDRRLADGQPDPTFAYPRISQELAIRAAMDGQGRIVVIKQAFDPDAAPVRVYRYSADGTIQSDYTTSLSAPGSYQGLPRIFYQGWGVICDAQGGALVMSASGYNDDPEQQFVRIAIDRVLPNGGIDTSFGMNGRLWVADSLNTDTGVVQVHIQPSGRILVSRASPKRETIVTAYSSGGALDTTFGTAGSITLAGTDGVVTPAIALDASGRIHVFIVVRGSVVGYRYSADGVRDSSFNATLSPGRTRNPLGVFMNGIVIGADGKITGASGAAVFRFNSDGTPDTDFDGDGLARLDSSDTNLLAVTDDSVYVHTQLGFAYGLARLIEEPPVFLNVVSGVLQVSGTSGDDTILIDNVGNDLRVTHNGDLFTFDMSDLKSIAVVGGDGADDIDVLVNAGGTAVLGKGGDNFRCAGGDWTVWGGYGNDTIRTGVGDDFVYADDGDDSVFTHAGNDTVYGLGGNDWIDGGEDDDLVRCVDGTNTILGGGGRDTLRGGSGDDSIAGQGGRDRLFGNDGNDTLTGGGNVDRLNGGPGNDLLIGGSGDDIFYDPRLASDATSIDTLIGGIGIDIGLFDDEDEAAEIETVLDELE